MPAMGEVSPHGGRDPLWPERWAGFDRAAYIERVRICTSHTGTRINLVALSYDLSVRLLA
jgi:hypothetical protein